MTGLIYGTIGSVGAALVLSLIGGSPDLWFVLAIFFVGVAWFVWLCGFVLEEIILAVISLARWSRRIGHRHTVRMRRYSHMAPLSADEIDTEGEAESPMGIRSTLGL